MLARLMLIITLLLYPRVSFAFDSANMNWHKWTGRPIEKTVPDENINLTIFVNGPIYMKYVDIYQMLGIAIIYNIEHKDVINIIDKRTQVCYKANDSILLILESDHMGHGQEISGYIVSRIQGEEADKYKKKCTNVMLNSKDVSTLSGISLGISSVSLLSIMGKPSYYKEGFYGYEYSVDVPVESNIHKNVKYEISEKHPTSFKFPRFLTFSRPG